MTTPQISDRPPLSKTLFHSMHSVHQIQTAFNLDSQPRAIGDFISSAMLISKTCKQADKKEGGIYKPADYLPHIETTWMMEITVWVFVHRSYGRLCRNDHSNAKLHTMSVVCSFFKMLRLILFSSKNTFYYSWLHYTAYIDFPAGLTFQSRSLITWLKS